MKEEMKVGPKGQVVIPNAFRKHLRMQPGSKVIVELKDNSVVIEKPRKDIIREFEKIAFSGKSAKVDSDKDYEKHMEERWKKIKRRNK